MLPSSSTLDALKSRLKRVLGVRIAVLDAYMTQVAASCVRTCSLACQKHSTNAQSGAQAKSMRAVAKCRTAFAWTIQSAPSVRATRKPVTWACGCVGALFR